MGSASVPAELLILRDDIDAIDAELLQALAKRFALSKRVGERKAYMDLEPFDGAREAEKLARLRALAADLGLNASLVDELFSRIMREAVQNHKQLREARE